MSNAIHQNGFDPLVVSEASEFDEVTHLVIPGVGNFSAAMPELESRNLVEGIRDFAESGRPLLGVCLGMHVLADRGEEGGTRVGLGLVPGVVRRMNVAPGMKLPHMGWNAMELKRAHPVFEGVKAGRDFYFVHSFGMEFESDEHVLALTDYDGPVTAVVGRANVVGFQFHPEKSQVNGLRLIDNFCRWDGKC